jgi:hypothetical protein
MVQSQVTLCTQNELFYLENAERRERGGEIVERKRKLEKKEILDRLFVYMCRRRTQENTIDHWGKICVGRTP